jgi:hypothetical protein
LDKSGAEVGAERPGELGAVAQEAEGEFDGVLAPDPDRQASIALALLEQDDVVVLVGVADAAKVADLHIEEVAVGGGWHGGLLRAARRAERGSSPDATGITTGEDEAGAPVTVVWLPGRRAAAGPALSSQRNFSQRSSPVRTRRSGTRACSSCAPARPWLENLTELGCRVEGLRVELEPC